MQIEIEVKSLSFVEYLHRGRIYRETDLPADLTLLEYLRDQRKLTGTKEGCASGDCGACTVVLVSLEQGGELHYKTVNACICQAAEISGNALVTVEDLQEETGELHPIQRSFIEHHSSQCGFCTPGFVMSAFALRKQVKDPSTEEVLEALSGNLCRCTGYRPIIDATRDPLAGTKDSYDRNVEQLKVELAGIQPEFQLVTGTGLSQPQSLSDLQTQLEHWPDAEFIAGGTDLCLDITQNLIAKPRLISLTRIAELKGIVKSQDGRVTIGACTTFSELLGFARSNGWSEFDGFLRRIAAEQVRNRGTIGGNLANASPIGDMPPVLLALEASVQLWSSTGERLLPLRSFFLSYRKTALNPGEIIKSISFNQPDSGFFVNKVSKRQDDDISLVCVAGSVTVSDGKVERISLGFGGMAEIPKTAPELEAFLVGRSITLLAEKPLADCLKQEFSPMTDLRGSADYRISVTAALIHAALNSIAAKAVGGAHE